MTRLFVRHDVTDYAAWRQVYDDFDATRRSMGVRDAGVYRNVDDGNEVTVHHDFADVESARAFAESDELRDTMARAGVAGAPTIWFTEAA